MTPPKHVCALATKMFSYKCYLTVLFKGQRGEDVSCGHKVADQTTLKRGFATVLAYLSMGSVSSPRLLDGPEETHMWNGSMCEIMLVTAVLGYEGRAGNQEI